MRHVLVTSIDIVVDDPEIFKKIARAVHEALKPFGVPYPTRETVVEFYVESDIPEVRARGPAAEGLGSASRQE